MGVKDQATGNRTGISRLCWSLIKAQQQNSRLGRYRPVFTVKTVWSVQCEVNVYWMGGNVTDLTDSLLLQATHLWQTCTRPNTPCVLQSNQPTVDSIKAEMTQDGLEKEKTFIQFSITHEFFFVCLGPYTDLPEQPPPLHSVMKGKEGRANNTRWD